MYLPTINIFTPLFNIGLQWTMWGIPFHDVIMSHKNNQIRIRTENIKGSSWVEPETQYNESPQTNATHPCPKIEPNN